MSHLAGLWLEADGASGWSVSPAIRPFGAGELSPPTRRAAELAMGRRLMALPTLSPVQGVFAVGHFERGGDVDAAAVVLIQYLQHILTEGRADHDLGLAAHWPGSLPQGLKPELRLLVRAAQVRVAQRSERPIGVLATHLQRELEQAQAESAPARMLAALALYEARVDQHLEEATPWLIEALRLASVLERDLGDLDFLKQTVWVHMGALREPAHLADLIEMLELVGPATRAAWDGEAEFAIGSRAVANQLWMTERDREQQDWSAVEDALEQLHSEAARLGLDVLAGAAAGASCVVKADIRRDLDAVRRVSQGALAGLTRPTARAMVLDSLGRQLVLHGAPAEGLVVLAEARATYPAASPLALDRFHALVFAARGAAELGRHDEADALLATANALAATEPRWIPGGERFAGLAETAMARWRADRLLEAWAPLDAAAELLFSLEPQDARWRDRVVLFGHALGFLSSWATTGQPPPALEDGPYGELPPGVFLTRVDGRADRFREDATGLLPEHLVLFAHAAGDHDRAVSWARRALAFSDDTGLEHLTHTSRWVSAAQALLDGAPVQALDHLLVSLRGLEAGRVRQAEPDIPFLSPVTLPELDTLPSDRLERVAGWLARVGVCSAAVVAGLGRGEAERQRWAADMHAWCAARHELRGTGAWRRTLGILEVARLPVALRRARLNGIPQPDVNDEPAAWALVEAIRAWDAGPRKRLIHDVGLAQVTEHWRAECGPIFDRTFATALADHWQETASTKGFLLRSPRLTRADLQSLTHQSPWSRLRGTLLALADGMGVPMDTRVRSWLSSTP